MLIQRTLRYSVLASFALTSLSAFAADPVDDKKAPATGPESGTSSPAEKKQENKDAAKTNDAKKAEPPADSSGGLLLPFGKIGPSVALNIPGLVNVGLDARLFKILGVGFDYGPTMSTGKRKSGDLEAELKLSHWDVRAAWFPWGGSLFVGGAFGSQKLELDATTNATVTVSGTSRKVPVKVSGNITTTFLTPHIGWQWLWDSGLMVGIRADSRLKNANMKLAFIESEGAFAPDCSQNRACGSAHGSSFQLNPLLLRKPRR